jgi:hypothetical protein
MDFEYAIPPVVHTVEDGFGTTWECPRGRPEAGCHLEVVRPGKVQCVLCDAAAPCAAQDEKGQR